MSDRIQGTARDIGGRVQSAAGDLTGDTRTQAEGAYNQVAGQAQDAAGQLGATIKRQPLTSVLIAVGVGYILGKIV